MTDVSKAAISFPFATMHQGELGPFLLSSSCQKGHAAENVSPFKCPKQEENGEAITRKDRKSR